MNAYKFVKENGLEKARKIIGEVPSKNYFTCFCKECGWGGSSENLYVDGYDRDLISCPKCASGMIESEDSVISELKQAIADFELVEVHGFEKSKEILANAPADAECYSWRLGSSSIRDKTVVLKDLKQAIERIEQGLKS